MEPKLCRLFRVNEFIMLHHGNDCNINAFSNQNWKWLFVSGGCSSRHLYANYNVGQYFRYVSKAVERTTVPHRSID